MKNSQIIFERDFLIKQLDSTKSWDAIVIGGGATGLGTALDFATRGFKTLLLEQEDFAKGTSSRSTKLVHGGVRYLEQGNIGLVKEALVERGLLKKNAPHLVKKQSFVVPSYNWLENIKYTVGLKIYDLLSGRLSFGKSIRISKRAVINRFSSIKTKNLMGGVLYLDGQFDDARLAINLAQSCIEKGATVLNYFGVEGLIKDQKGMVSGVKTRDKETHLEYNLQSKVVINATGVFADDVLNLDKPNTEQTIIPSQGVHLVFDKAIHPGIDALMIPKTTDGRVLFVIPWQNKVLVGTTDTKIEKQRLEPVALDEEVEFIIKNLNNYLNKEVGRKDVLSVFCGLRPLARPKEKSEKTKKVSRSHKISVSKSELITIVGGKWTTYRKMAEDVVEKAIKVKNLPYSSCKTKNLMLHGATKEQSKYSSIYGTDQKIIENLILEKPYLAELLHPNLPFTKAQVVLAVRYEMARTIEDVLARRVRILFLDSRASLECVRTVGEIIKTELNKNELWLNEQITKYEKIAKNYVLD